MENNLATDTSYNTSKDHYFVGIGASAGGLEAINELFDHMPSNTGFSFIIIQHLSPDHKSLMGELLAKHTSMPVLEAEDGVMPKPNAVYLIPTKKIIMIRNGRIRLEDKIRDHHPNTAIDSFFESLGIDKGEKAVGIILSGTGTDGTRGIEAIKKNGGSIIIQDPLSAQFDGMPNSAIASGYADLILSPDIMPDEIIEFIKEAPLLRSFNKLSNQDEAILLDILELVLKQTNHDFSDYKRPTITRRLARRMAEKNIRSLVDYYRLLTSNEEEVKKLCKEFLLHVTKFFRDEEAFDSLAKNIIPKIIGRKQKDEVVKVWTVACSTGEEAYSLAILFDECAQALQRMDIEVKIFASDIGQEVIDFGSKGLYSAAQVKNVSNERLAKYFVKEAAGFRVTPALRKMIVFARHDITKDPPFSRIDLLTCRNMLIYMNPILQKNILNKFHFAMNESGFLFLGQSENIGVLREVMVEVDKKWKIYKCISKTKVADLESFSNPVQRPANAVTSAKMKNALNNLSDIFKETLLEEYDFAGIFIDKDFEVKQATGNFKKFLDFPEGAFNFNLLKLVQPELSIALSTSIRKAIKENDRVIQRNVQLSGPPERAVTIIVKPYLVQKQYLQPFVFVILKEEEIVPRRSSLTLYSREGYSNERIEELESELKDTKENLQALIEEVEMSNEELQSSNEEIISSNEELQSTNEELQSLNEELHTVNAEHQLKIKELIELNDDLNNYFLNSDVGQILIDAKMTIRKFTPVATKMVNLIPGDIGRSIVDISTNMSSFNFISDIKSAMEKQLVVEREIPMEDGKTYLMRIAPFLRQNKTVDGLVITFIDVSEITKVNSILSAVFNSSTSGITAMQAMRDERGEIIDFKFISANRAAYLMLGFDDTIMKKTFKQVYGHVDPSVFERYRQVVTEDIPSSFEMQNSSNGKWFEIVCVKMMDGIVVTFSDITDRKLSSERISKGYEDLKRASQQLELSNFKLEQSNLDLLQFASVASHDLKEPLRKIQAFGNLLKDRIKDQLDSTQSNYLDKVINSSNRMQVLIDDILTLSRLSKNDTPHAMIPLEQVVRQIIDDLEVSIREKHAIIDIDKLPTVCGIPGQMHQLFQNLISNSIKFNEGAPVISINEEPIAPELVREFKFNPRDYAAVCVRDNGIGFESRFSEKIFGVFQRLEKTNYQGTGIGLAIVKKIVDNHKGFIKAVSEVGKGAAFMIILPTKKQAPDIVIED